MIEQMLNRTVTIIHRSLDPAADDFDGPTATAVTTETVGSLDQVQRTEPDSRGELSSVAFTLFLPPDVSIDADDAVLVDGATYELVGEPWPVENKRTGQIHHLECTVERTGSDDAGS